MIIEASEKIPEEWDSAHIISIFKLWNKVICSNYRGIALLSTI
jgi:hypothetical protein